MIGRVGPESLRWAWLVPAVAAAVATAVVLGVLRLLDDSDLPGGPTQRRLVGVAATSSEPTTPSETTSGAPGSGRLRLEESGLGAVEFDQPESDVVDALSARLGVPDEDDTQPCGRGSSAQSRWVRWADLTLRFSDGRFAAYIEGIHYPPGHPPYGISTADGLTPGDSVDRLRRIYGDSLPSVSHPASPQRVATSVVALTGRRLGDGLSGVVEGEGSSQVVASIFAGAFC